MIGFEAFFSEGLTTSMILLERRGMTSLSLPYCRSCPWHIFFNPQSYGLSFSIVTRYDDKPLPRPHHHLVGVQCGIDRDDLMASSSPSLLSCVMMSSSSLSKLSSANLLQPPPSGAF